MRNTHPHPQKIDLRFTRRQNSKIVCCATDGTYLASWTERKGWRGPRGLNKAQQTFLEDQHLIAGYRA